VPGVVRTRVGYTGGSKKDPTYHDLGDHTESVQVDYDPARVSYRRLLEVFFATHNGCAASGSRQYMSAVFYHDEGQKKLALEAREREAARRGQPVVTEVLPLKAFYLAEDYHQKYMLRQNRDLMREFRAMYPAAADFVASTSAARVNGYVGGHGSRADLEREIESLGLSPEGRRTLLGLCKK
jgi:methionine-S-sulfoxide reductase